MVKTIKATRELILQTGKQTINIESSIGQLKFRKIFAKDTELLFKYKENNADEFCKHFIINQLKTPKLTIEELNRLNITEISSIVKNYLTKSQLIEYFDFETEFYTDFQDGILNFIESGLKTTQKIMNNLHMPDAMKTFMNNTYPLSTPPNIVEDVSKNIMIIVEPQQKIWKNQIEENEKFKEIQKRNEKYWDKALERYNLTKKEAFDNLKRYHWIISPNMNKKIVYDVVEIFNSDSKHKHREINSIYNSYFFGNDCKNLSQLLEIWGSKIRFHKQINIIKDCIEVIKNMDDDFNFSNVIVPTLISQIEGIQMSFMEEKFLKVDNEGVIWIDEQTKLRDKHNSRIKINTYFKNLVEGDEFLEAMNWLFLDILFQTTYPGEPYSEPIHFSRNKILHGENTNYGRKDYACRCFLILDFLSELSHE